MGDLRAARGLETQQYLEVRGGSAATRGAIVQTGQLNQTLLQRFFDQEPEGAIDYQFTPIWDLFVDHSAGDAATLQLAYNLRAAYEGLLPVGCPRIAVKDETELVHTDVGHGTTHIDYKQDVVQEFRRLGQGETQQYECFNAATGCRQDADCHGVWPTHCYCGGPTCFVEGDALLGGGFRTVVGHYWGKDHSDCTTGDCNGCYRSASDQHCHCAAARPHHRGVHQPKLPDRAIYGSSADANPTGQFGVAAPSYLIA